MATMAKLKDVLAVPQELSNKVPTPDKPCSPIKIDITRLRTDELEDIESATSNSSRTTLHIYHPKDCAHKLITPTLSPSQERRFGPKPSEQKARRLAKKAAQKLRENAFAQNTQPPPTDQGDADATYFLHTPYLSFHAPPCVLYAGTSKHRPASPVALIHNSFLWRKYKIQLGPSLSLPGVIDPRGVVSWSHNGGTSDELARDARDGDGRMLKGYRVRGWRLWGETGKAYVHGVRDKRRAGISFDDPDVSDIDEDGDGHGDGDGDAEIREKVRADEVVYLAWRAPLSRQTRCYAFTFRSVGFQWKGTGTVSEERKCGWMLRFCHLKLVARVPACKDGEMGELGREVCLAKYTTSIAAEKHGVLEIYDRAVVRFVGAYMPELLLADSFAKTMRREEKCEGGQNYVSKDFETESIAHLKKGVLYQLIVATTLCMVNAEKEKRHTLIDLVIGAGENAGNGGG